MKILPYILLFFTVPAIAQESVEPFRKANQIIIQTDDSKEVAFNKLTTLLMQNGYAIESADKEIGYINTELRSVKYANYILNFSITDSIVYITGVAKNIVEVQMQKLGKTHIATMAFREADKLARLYKDAKIKYSRI